MGIDNHANDAIPHVVYAFDAGFRYCSILSAYSILKHRSAPTRISFLSGQEMPGISNAVELLSKAFPKAKLEVLVKPELNFKFETVDRIPTATYQRLSLNKYFSGRILYLDGDTFVRRDIASLFETDLKGKAFGAAMDSVIERDVFYADWWLLKKTKNSVKEILLVPHLINARRYVNSGVLLMDLQSARTNQAVAACFNTDAAVAFRIKYDFRYQDQDWFNHAAADHIHLLNPEWNALWGNHRTNRPPLPRSRRKAYRESRNNPALVHVTGQTKPWLKHGYKIPKAARRWDREYKDLMREMTLRLGVELRDSLL